MDDISTPGMRPRIELGERRLTFRGEHPGAKGLTFPGKDPKRYIHENG
ncbi:hypothetical protein AB0M46_10515 [Dactylosporangium sp. NPDC051485]